MSNNPKGMSDDNHALLIEAGYHIQNSCYCEGTLRVEYKKDDHLLKVYPHLKSFKSSLDVRIKHHIDELKEYLQNN